MVRTRYINELENLKNEIILYSATVEKMLMDMKVIIEEAPDSSDLADKLSVLEAKDEEIQCSNF